MNGTESDIRLCSRKTVSWCGANCGARAVVVRGQPWRRVLQGLIRFLHRAHARLTRGLRWTHAAHARLTPDLRGSLTAYAGPTRLTRDSLTALTRLTPGSQQQAESSLHERMRRLQSLCSVVEKITVPGMRAPRSGDQPPQAVRFSSGHSGSVTESMVKPAATSRRTQSLIVR